MARMQDCLGITIIVVMATMIGGCGEKAEDASSETLTARNMSVIPSGTTLVVSLDAALSTDLNQSGDNFTATMKDPIVVALTVRRAATEMNGSSQCGERFP